MTSRYPAAKKEVQLPYFWGITGKLPDMGEASGKGHLGRGFSHTRIAVHMSRTATQ